MLLCKCLWNRCLSPSRWHRCCYVNVYEIDVYHHLCMMLLKLVSNEIPKILGVSLIVYLCLSNDVYPMKSPKASLIFTTSAQCKPSDRKILISEAASLLNCRRVSRWFNIDGVCQISPIWQFPYLVVHPTDRKWVITLVISGLIPLIPFITRVITHLRSVGWTTK